MVISAFIGMTKACGNRMLVTRMWVCASLIRRSVCRRMPYSVRSTRISGRSYSRSTLLIGRSESAGTPRNCLP